MMKLKQILIVFSVAILLITGCQKADSTTDRDDPVILESDPSVLKERMSSSKAGIIFLDNSLPNKQLQASIRANTTTFGTTTAQVNLTLVKEILPPVIKGQLVRVTHVAVAGNYAYVSYNREGETYLGGIDVIDIRDKNNPVLISSAGLPNMDISSLAVEGNNLYFVGAADVETIQGITSPAISGLLALNGGLPSSNYSLNALSGQVATDFTLDADYKYVVTGSNGIISKIDKNSEVVVKSIPITGLLSVRTNANHVIALSADKGLFVFDKDLNAFSILNKSDRNCLNPH